RCEGRIEMTADKGEQAGFAAAARPRHRDDLAWPYGEAEIGNQHLIADAQADMLQHQAHAGSLSPARSRCSRAGTAMAAAKTSSGSSAWAIAKTPRMRRSLPADSVTASVVSVAIRPAPANSVGRYCPTLTAKPMANANSSGR